MSFGAVLAERLAASRRRCQLKGDQSCRTIVPGSHVTVNDTNPPTSCSKWPSSDPGSQTASYAVSAPARVDAIILGAGISGLVAARILKQRGYEQIVVRDNARLRRAPTTLTSDWDRLNGRGLQLVERLGSWNERIVNGRREVVAEVPIVGG